MIPNIGISGLDSQTIQGWFFFVGADEENHTYHNHSCVSDESRLAVMSVPP
jgi:hypothetical protein